jgi:hypothetical protein
MRTDSSVFTASHVGTGNALGRVPVKAEDRRGARQKTDEDIAERMSGGVRLDRSSLRREHVVAHDQPERRDKTPHRKRPHPGR